VAQKDKYHDAVKRALIADGWDVTHDPYLLRFGRRRALIDFGAQPALGASRGTETIAVEVKTFASYSQLMDLEKALGQYLLYRSWLQRTDPQRVLYLAVGHYQQALFDEEAIVVLVDDYQVLLIFVDLAGERIVAWRT
jgi:hypothetical protein